MKYSLRSLLLSILSGVLFWIAWPPHRLGWVSFVAFVPLLFIHEYRKNGYIKAAMFRVYTYLGLLMWNILTTWWIWYATPGGCIAAIVLNAFFMSLVWWLFDLVSKRSSEFISYLFLITLWLGYEYMHLNWEITWPWLVLGNIFANNTALIQWYEFTGHLGGSLWILLMNILVFKVIRSVGSEVGFSKSRMVFAFTLLVPIIISGLLLTYRDADTNVSANKVLVIQPNLDPYSEKFNDSGEALSPAEQLERMLTMAEEKMSDSVSFVVLPETALQGGIDESDLMGERLLGVIRDFARRHPQTCVITGADSYTRYPDKQTQTARQYREGGDYFDFFNTALQLDCTEVIRIYHKSKLVPGVEKLPYPIVFGGLVRMLNLEAEAGGLGTQAEASVFKHSGANVAPLICYESVFGDYVREFVRKDAGVFFVITNDGWWGNTDGYKQHLLYGKLRCIEFRKELIQCANTGLSAHINTNGEIDVQTSWWKQEVMKTGFTNNNGKTFYALYGDYIGWLGASISIMMMIWMLAKRLGYKNE